MPRRKHPNSGEPKKRSRTGCWPCKARKVKCGEEKPHCSNCVKQGEECDYSIRLQWGGRSKKDQDAFAAISTSSSHTSSFRFSAAAPTSPGQAPSIKPWLPAASGFTCPPPSHKNLPLHAEYVARQVGDQADKQRVLLDPQLMPQGNPPSLGQLADYSENLRHQSGQQCLDDVDPAQSTPYFPGQSLYSLTCSSKSSPATPQSSAVSHERSRSSLHYSSDFAWSDQHKAKRARLDSRVRLQKTLPPPNSWSDSSDIAGSNAPVYRQASLDTALNNAPGALAIPRSSLATEDISTCTVSKTNGHGIKQTPALKRFSVSSLLSGPPGVPSPFSYAKVDVDGCIIYGYDHGFPDLDVAWNSDSTAIIPQTPAAGETTPAAESPLPVPSGSPSPASSKEAAFQRGGYYAQPVPIKISKAFEPLPSYLTDSPMNLLYFHHFTNHTARVLTPHDCPDNPLRTILPQMAMQNPDLLNLILAYSASHRARLLSHPEPKDRIAYWVRDVFRNLRHALSSPGVVSDAVLATAIMLASREIITPNTFEVNIPWQNHLGIARQMIIQRGGLKDMGSSGSPVVNFLARWFAYLDVIGSLSGHKNDAPLTEAYWCFPQCVATPGSTKSSVEGDDHGFGIDCFFGFTNCCISLLARVAKLAHECDQQRIDSSSGEIDTDWRPSGQMKSTAEWLIDELNANQDHVYAGCRHSKHSGKDWEALSEANRQGMQEMVNANKAFHLAGSIHLYRRVLGRQSADEEVQECVRSVLAALSQVRKGGTTESCLLFPMFTAGCDAIEQEHRDTIMERLKLVEGLGMTHVQKARTLMQTSWETGKPWETLVSGEFFG